MAKRSSQGVAAWFDRSTVAQCPSCEAEDPDPARRGFCATCGALFRDKVRSRWQLAQAATLLGLALVLTGAALALFLDQKWPGLAVFALGMASLAFGLLTVGGHARSLLAALELRSTPETLRLLSGTDRLCAIATLIFTALFVACIPYYLYIEAPRQKLGSYQNVFGDKVQEYAALVVADAVVPEDAVAQRVGKLLVLERSSESPAQVSPLHAQLSPDVRADAASEVGTVALIDWVDVRTGWYGERDRSPPAYRVDAHVTLIDAATKAVTAKIVPPSGAEPHEFNGGDPPSTAPSGGQPGRGARATTAVIKFLTNLPIGEPVEPRAAAPASE